MATFVRVGTDWPPASTARPGPKHSIFGSRGTAPGTPHDRRDIVALVPRRQSNVNVTMPIGRISGQSWYADETYLKVHGRWCYLYRAIDRDGNLIDTMLSATRDMKAARRFFRSARSVAGFVPDRVTTDGHNSYPRAIRSTLGCNVRHAYKRLPEQPTRTGPSRDQRTHPMYARLQGA